MKFDFFNNCFNYVCAWKSTVFKIRKYIPNEIIIKLELTRKLETRTIKLYPSA